MGNAGASTIHELRAAIEAGQCDPRQLLDDLLQRIAQHDPRLHAYIHVEPQRLRAALKERVQRGPRGRLFGVPITVKDNICIQGEETGCGSRILTGFRPPYHATVIERLLAEGAIVIPRANMDEFAFGSSTETSHFGATRNPWDPERVPGGSSGGCAAAVAADLALGALGSDTGGSIRQPAAFCGVVGLKPTYGRVSRYGLVAFASSLDQIGPITKDVRDCALLLSVIAGPDPRDSTSAPVEVPDYVSQLHESVKGLKIGLPTLPREGLDQEVRQKVDEAINVLKKIGLELVGLGEKRGKDTRSDFHHISESVAAYYVIATAEASSNLARYDGVQYGTRAATEGQGSLLKMYLRTRAEGFGPEAKRRIMLGTYVLSRGYYEAYYLKAMKVRTLIKRDFDEAFAHCDVVVMPTAPTPAFRLGEKLNNPLQMYLSDIYTISANLAGVPAMSIPCGFSREGLPIGIQFCAAPFREDVLLRVAYAYEQATEWHRQSPAVSLN
ncbi:MAG: Asp-tRNA(Asn)/Glu-tRNA(Gln) amidotransferase subunit GatA [Nitrospirota bacterium]